MANGQIVTAYRHLYRRLLQAVQYASPARHVARDQLRTAFREPGAAYDGEGVKRTIWFLEAAARERGLEHRILKNLIRVRLAQLRQLRSWRKTLHDSKQRNDMREDQQTALHHYDMTVAMLNKSMGLCLR